MTRPRALASRLVQTLSRRDFVTDELRYRCPDCARRVFLSGRLRQLHAEQDAIEARLR